MEKRKYLGYANTNYVREYTSRIIRVDDGEYLGYASFIRINAVYKPMFVGAYNKICIADDGYGELCYLPDGENWQMYALYDGDGRIVEWYYDITRENGVDEDGSPYAEDLYLDAALSPDGKITILDSDELQTALDVGHISQDGFDLARCAMDRLIKDKIIGLKYAERLCEKLLPLFSGM